MVAWSRTVLEPLRADSLVPGNELQTKMRVPQIDSQPHETDLQMALTTLRSDFHPSNQNHQTVFL